MPVAAPFLARTVTFVPTVRSATVLPSGRIFVAEETATDCVLPSASLTVRVVVPLAVATLETVPTR